MWRLLRVSVVACIVLLAGFQGSQVGLAQTTSGWTIYDTFDAKSIDAPRWRVAVNPIGYETTLEQVNQRLKMESQAYGPPITSGGLSSSLRLLARNPLLVKGVAVTLRINDAKVTGAADSRAGARLRAWLFRDGPTPSDPNDFTNLVSILVVATVRASEPNTVSVFWFSERCNDYNCDTSTVREDTFSNATFDTDITLAAEVDPVTNALIVSKDGEVQTASNIATYLPINFNLGGRDVKGVEIYAALAGAPPQASAWVSVTFDNFRVKY